MAVPTLYEWAGGAEALERLTERFYVKVKADPCCGQWPVGRSTYSTSWIFASSRSGAQ